MLQLWEVQSVYLSGHDTALLGGDIAADRSRACGALLPADGWGFSVLRDLGLELMAVEIDPIWDTSIL